LRSKLEKYADSNADLLKDNKKKDKTMFELKEDLDKLQFKVIKYKDKKRLLDKKIKEALQIE
jgi:hypothetical protein